MKVKDLKELLNDADDNLEVMICMDDTFDYVAIDNSGVITFGEPCDADGKQLSNEEGPTVFALISKVAADEMQEATA